MRSLPVEFLELVEEDLRHASDFYDSWQFEGAKKFREKFRETIFWIGWNPEMLQIFSTSHYPKELLCSLLRY